MITQSKRKNKGRDVFVGFNIDDVNGGFSGSGNAGRGGNLL